MFEICVITFLGTGGGRFATIYQPRWTGGIYVEDNVRLHIDPGPGALVRMLDMGMDPALTDLIFISHSHPDHYSDAEILIEALTYGCTKKRGILLASRSLIRGAKNYSPSISRYHRSHLEKIVVFTRGKRYRMKGLSLVALPAYHSDSSAIGLRIKTSAGDISYTGDTELRENLIVSHRNSRVLIVCATCPRNIRMPFHMTIEDVAALVTQVKPELAVLTHFGLSVLKEGPENHAKFITKSADVWTVAARDGLKLKIGKEIKLDYRT